MKNFATMKYLNAEDIVNDLFKVSGLDFEIHYDRFYKEATKVLNEWIKEELRRILSDFEGGIEGGFWIPKMYMESVPKETSLALSFAGKKDYCEGYNECVKQHDEIAKKLKEIILDNIKIVLTN